MAFDPVADSTPESVIRELDSAPTAKDKESLPIDMPTPNFTHNENHTNKAFEFIEKEINRNQNVAELEAIRYDTEIELAATGL